MNWRFWENEPVAEKKPVVEKVGSFLFATDVNSLGVLSVGRIASFTDHTQTKYQYYTRVVFRGDKGLFVEKNSYDYPISHCQHEDFVDKLSKEIECLVTPGV